MPSIVGTTVQIALFGQSHAPCVGCTVSGLPAGIPIDFEALRSFMQRRAPGLNPWSTTRVEADDVRIVTGLNPHNATCGTPLTLLIDNTNTRSQDYAELARIPRPGHADWVAQLKWGSFHDIAGGGHFSARLTAALCAAASICMQVLAKRNIGVAAHLFECAGIADTPFAALGNPVDEAKALKAQLDALGDGRLFPTINKDAGAAMQNAIEQARLQNDSVGGIVECVVVGMPAGIGSPHFDGVENAFARAAFGIPAVKGIEFGRGFEAARMRGSEHNDPYQIHQGAVCVAKNDAGGALGGITTGAPIVFRLAMKPTSSIGQEQDSVNLETKKECKLVVRGRHDPCIAPRAVPVAEAVAAIVALDLLMSYPAHQVF